MPGNVYCMKFNQLFRCFEVHHNRLERLEAARDCHLAIQLQHLRYTLDPAVAEWDRTLPSLKKLLRKESKISVKDKLALDEDINSLEGKHNKDQEFLTQRAKAGWLFDYYHQKLVDSDADLEFDIRNLSDVSDDESSTSERLKKYHKDWISMSTLPYSASEEDVTMQDGDSDNPAAVNSNRDPESLEIPNALSNSQDLMPPQCWGSFDEDEDTPQPVDLLPINNQTWTTQ